MMNAEATYKLCIFGDGGVGKTSLTRRFLTGLFELETEMTMGASIFVKYLEIEGKKIALQIWDFGGEEKFQFLLPVYAHGSSAGIFMYDVTRFTTLKKIDDWLSFFKQGLTKDEKDIPVLMVGGKKDLEEKRSCSAEEASQIAKDHNLFSYIECSAKSGENVEDIFSLVTTKILKNLKF